MIKRKLLKIGLILTLSFTLLTGCGSKENTNAKVDTSTTIEEDTSDTKLVANNSTEKNTTAEKDTTTEKDSTTEKDTTAEAEATQPVTEALKPVETQPATEAPKPVETQPATEAPKPVETQPATEAPKGSFDNPISDDTPKETKKDTEPVVVEDHSKDDYNWAVAKVAEWKAINPDPAYLIGMFECYAQSNWYYNTTMDGGAFKHAISYYGSGVCTDIETCFHTFCDVAGIPCERIEDWSVEGGHTWDKVTIDGVQYEVDMTNAICNPSFLGRYNELVESFNQTYYGTKEHSANRFCSVLGLKPNYK